MPSSGVIMLFAILDYQKQIKSLRNDFYGILRGCSNYELGEEKLAELLRKEHDGAIGDSAGTKST